MVPTRTCKEHYIYYFQDECEAKLAIAMPAMNAAIAALDTLKQNDISLVKTMTNPPNGVKLVMEAVCIMKALKPEKKVDGTGKAFEDFWPTAKKVKVLYFRFSFLFLQGYQLIIL